MPKNEFISVCPFLPDNYPSIIMDEVRVVLSCLLKRSPGVVFLSCPLRLSLEVGFALKPSLRHCGVLAKDCDGFQWIPMDFEPFESKKPKRRAARV